MSTYRADELQGIIKINPEICKGCDSCKSFCPTDAINGAYGATHEIDGEKCLQCGQCLVNCPFGAIEDMADAVPAVKKKLADKETTVVATVAPAVRVALGEEFGIEPGKLLTEEMYGALKQAGFKIMDVNFAADNTIMEEGTELVEKIKKYVLGEPSEHELGPLPQFTSCCPAWVRYMELYHPKLTKHLSSAKSPQGMAGPVAKIYGATEVWHTEPENIYCVGVYPCTAKKYEASRPEFTSAADYWKKRGHTATYQDTDVVLTTRDLARLLKDLNIDLKKVEPITESDNPLAEYSGAGTIFGNTGGVMEAALRTAYFVLTGEELQELNFMPVRGLEAVKSAAVPLKLKDGREIELKVAVVHGTKNVEPLIQEIEAGKSPYHFIEVMNCPGGCVNGGGQPINPMGTSWTSGFKAIMPWN
ncbi:ferredoxin hydrogenase large subunit [Selenomonas ruminantium]|uniref:Ferredoxin hydrogenase large subunit n=1 Tax=Selenomonas ruminantium TaxID=971 RepID=A0A1M6TZT7_SELRU|nr:[FeFe] hydrogenase, group A [Selenomonas ruminantium]SHK62410.1 ferredoxin hydrogenase large subunit [Selenomonas ruminantium]